MTTETRSHGWAPVALTALLLLAGGLLVLLIDRYFGVDGVRLVSIVLGIMVIILFTVGLGFGVMWAASRLAMRHHDNVLQGIVDFQNADDRGEVARSLANSLRSGNQLDSRVLTLAGTMARQQANAIVASRTAGEQPQPALGGPTWAMGAEVDGDFHMVQ